MIPSAEKETTTTMPGNGVPGFLMLQA
jgi:hypothetical protein